MFSFWRKKKPTPSMQLRAAAADALEQAIIQRYYTGFFYPEQGGMTCSFMCVALHSMLALKHLTREEFDFTVKVIISKIGVDVGTLHGHLRVMGVVDGSTDPFLVNIEQHNWYWRLIRELRTDPKRTNFTNCSAARPLRRD